MFHTFHKTKYERKYEKKKTFTQGDVQMIFFNDFFFIIVSCADMLLRLVAGGTIIKNAITNKKA